MAAKLKNVLQSKEVQHFVENLKGIPLEMILIPPGTFMMGAPEAEAESLDSERPQHRVTVSMFFMGRYPITQAQWKVVAQMPQVQRELKLNPSRFEGDKRPVERVSWYDAIEFCARLSRHTKREYRLPSEAEWEYACRAGTTTPFHFGETISTELANYNSQSEKYGAYGRGLHGKYRRETTDVDFFGVANSFGLSDMHGNVWEWCLDPWHGNYEGAPEDGSVWDDENNNDNHYQNISENLELFLKDGRNRVIRGGSWFSGPRGCRSAYRNYFIPRVDDVTSGFRVVCGVPRTL
ncbi:MAG: formylglycine-generating enzyme family protein [Xenococcaceae cyanobacterium]